MPSRNWRQASRNSYLYRVHQRWFCSWSIYRLKLGIKSAAMCRYERRLSWKPVYKVRLAPTTPRQSHSPRDMGYKAVNPAHRIGGSRPSDCVGVQGLAKSAATPLDHNRTERPRLQSLRQMPPPGDHCSWCLLLTNVPLQLLLYLISSVSTYVYFSFSLPSSNVLF